MTNYLSPSESLDINRLAGIGNAADRELLEDLLGLESSELQDAELNHFLPLAFNRLADECDEPCFFKIHYLFQLDDAGNAIFPAGRAVYLMRNPLDVVVSLANHEGETFDSIVQRMNRGHTLNDSSEGIYRQLPQPLGNWSDHIHSWVKQNVLPVFLLRYEDLLLDPAGMFSEVLRFLNLPVERSRVEIAVNKADFKELRSQEEIRGFRERPETCPRFFLRGRAGSWRDLLSSRHVEQIVKEHADTMRAFGYLTEEGTVVG